MQANIGIIGLGTVGAATAELIDRGGDIIELFDYFIQEHIEFVIRAKKNKKLIDLKTGEVKKAEEFDIGSYDVEIQASGTKLRFHKIKNVKNKKPIMFYTNTEYGAEKCLELYLKRWSIEEDFKKMKNKLGLEDIRVFQMQKIQFCRMYSVTMNPHSFITYLSIKLPLFHSNSVNSRPDYGLFAGRGYLKKMGCI